VSAQDSGNDSDYDRARARGEVVTTFYRLLTSGLIMFKAAFDAVGNLLKAIGDGIERGSRLIGDLALKVVEEAFLFCRDWLRSLRPRRKVRQTQLTQDPSDANPIQALPLIPEVSFALRQAEGDEETAKLFELKAQIKISEARQVAKLAEDRARSYQALQLDNSAVSALYFPSGLRYSGDLHDGQADGHGILQDQNSTIFRGQLSGNKINGLGHYSKAGQKSYEGQFSQNEYHGLGQLRTKEYQFIGQFAYGKIVGFGVLFHLGTASEWVKHVGQFMNAEADGYGIRIYRDGQIHRGEFRKDEPHGYGVRESEGAAPRAGRWNGEYCEEF
jgi:hypothetical protein